VAHARHEAAEKRAVESHRRDMHLKQLNTVRALEQAIKEKEGTGGAAIEVMERQLADAVEALRDF
jgi:type III secretory pathway lipoprotein EscJ